MMIKEASRVIATSARGSSFCPVSSHRLSRAVHPLPDVGPAASLRTGGEPATAGGGWSATGCTAPAASRWSAAIRSSTTTASAAFRELRPTAHTSEEEEDWPSAVARRAAGR